MARRWERRVCVCVCGRLSWHYASSLLSPRFDDIWLRSRPIIAVMDGAAPPTANRRRSMRDGDSDSNGWRMLDSDSDSNSAATSDACSLPMRGGRRLACTHGHGSVLSPCPPQADSARRRPWSTRAPRRKWCVSSALPPHAAPPDAAGASARRLPWRPTAAARPPRASPRAPPAVGLGLMLGLGPSWVGWGWIGLSED